MAFAAPSWNCMQPLVEYVAPCWGIPAPAPASGALPSLLASPLHKESADKRPTPNVPGLTKARAIALQYELLTAYEQPRFHRRVETLKQQCLKNEISRKDFSEAFKKLVRRCQAEILPKYCFEPTDEGNEAMVSELFRLADNPMIAELNAAIARALANSLPPAEVPPEAPKAKLEEPPAEATEKGEPREAHALLARPARFTRTKSGPRPRSKMAKRCAEDTLELPDRAEREPKVPVPFTKARACALLTQLKVLFMGKSFQHQVLLLDNKEHEEQRQILDDGGLEDTLEDPLRVVAPEVRKLAAKGFAEILPLYGFPGTEDGMRQMWQALRPLLEKPVVSERLESALKLLRAPVRDAAPGPVEDPKFRQKRMKVLSWLQALMTAYQQPAFQKRLNELQRRQLEPSHPQYGHTIEDLAWTVIPDILRSRWQPPTEESVRDLTLCVGECFMDRDVQVFVTAVDDTLYGTEIRGEGGELARRGAVGCLREQLAGFSTGSFQRQIHGLREAFRRTECDDFLHLDGRAELALGVQQEVLPKYGFEGTAEGVRRMFIQCSVHATDPEVARLTDAINEKLGMEGPARQHFLARLQATAVLARKAPPAAALAA